MEKEQRPENETPVTPEEEAEKPAAENAAGQEAPGMEEKPEETGETGETGEEGKKDANPLQAKIEQAEAKVAEYLAMAQRVQADFENFRRRNESVRADAFADGRREVAAAMLPVLDNLERAAEAAANSGDESMKNGVQLVLKQMQEIYKKMEVTPIDRLGEKFDPNLENAILQGTPEDGEAGTVCQVLQKGYMMGTKVLRHAMVKVVPE